MFACRSGEYSLVKAAAQLGFMDERRTVLENLTAMRRAGADAIITYHALDAARQGRMIERRPLEIARVGDAAPPARGFLFGAGAFAKATELAQHTPRAGAFNNLAVGLALGWGVAQTLFGTAEIEAPRFRVRR